MSTFYSYISGAHTHCSEKTNLGEEINWLISVAEDCGYKETDVQKLIAKLKLNNKRTEYIYITIPSTVVQCNMTKI